MNIDRYHAINECSTSSRIVELASGLGPYCLQLRLHDNKTRFREQLNDKSHDWCSWKGIFSMLLLMLVIFADYCNQFI